MRHHIAALFAASHDHARKLADTIDPADFSTIRGAKNPAWLIGHMAIAADFACALAGSQMTLGEWMPLFGPGSEPTDTAGAYPDKQALLDALANRHAAAEQVFKGLSDAQLAAELPVPDYRAMFPTVGEAMAYLLAAHEPYHIGQLQQWTKATVHA